MYLFGAMIISTLVYGETIYVTRNNNNNVQCLLKISLKYSPFLQLFRSPVRSKIKQKAGSGHCGYSPSLSSACAELVEVSDATD